MFLTKTIKFGNLTNSYALYLFLPLTERCTMPTIKDVFEFHADVMNRFGIEEPWMEQYSRDFDSLQGAIEDELGIKLDTPSGFNSEDTLEPMAEMYFQELKELVGNAK